MMTTTKEDLLPIGTYLVAPRKTMMAKRKTLSMTMLGGPLGKRRPFRRFAIRSAKCAKRNVRPKLSN